MAKITREIQIDYTELLELIQSRYPAVTMGSFAEKPYLEIVESGSHDSGTYDRKLKSITFYIKES
jgi:hypothetical protein